jgi:hypothetical protein
MKQRFESIVRRAAPWFAALALAVTVGLVTARGAAAQQPVAPSAPAAARSTAASTGTNCWSGV